MHSHPEDGGRLNLPGPELEHLPDRVGHHADDRAAGRRRRRPDDEDAGQLQGHLGVRESELHGGIHHRDHGAAQVDDAADGLGHRGHPGQGLVLQGSSFTWRIPTA